ncbi:hypothetical protein F4810DRAFT_609156 [Camillea tinctor]|nr:hypothetical protein F4810DRAFT_609156 [Camillea tinctor]
MARTSISSRGSLSRPRSSSSSTTATTAFSLSQGGVPTMASLRAARRGSKGAPFGDGLPHSEIAPAKLTLRLRCFYRPSSREPSEILNIELATRLRKVISQPWGVQFVAPSKEAKLYHERYHVLIVEVNLTHRCNNECEREDLSDAARQLFDGACETVPRALSRLKGVGQFVYRNLQGEGEHATPQQQRYFAIAGTVFPYVGMIQQEPSSTMTLEEEAEEDLEDFNMNTNGGVSGVPSSGDDGKKSISREISAAGPQLDTILKIPRLLQTIESKSGKLAQDEGGDAVKESVGLNDDQQIAKCAEQIRAIVAQMDEACDAVLKSRAKTDFSDTASDFSMRHGDDGCLVKSPVWDIIDELLRNDKICDSPVQQVILPLLRLSTMSDVLIEKLAPPMKELGRKHSKRHQILHRCGQVALYTGAACAGILLGAAAIPSLGGPALTGWIIFSTMAASKATMGAAGITSVITGAAGSWCGNIADNDKKVRDRLQKVRDKHALVNHARPPLLAALAAYWYEVECKVPIGEIDQDARRRLFECAGLDAECWPQQGYQKAYLEAAMRTFLHHQQEFFDSIEDVLSLARATTPAAAAKVDSK